MKPPAFQFYAEDFLAGTLDMSQAEVGAYIRLLCHQWDKGFLSQDREKLQRIAGGPVSEDVLSKFQVGSDGLLRNVRLETERVKQQEYRTARAEDGRRGGGNPVFKKGTPNPYYNKGSISEEDKEGLSEKDKHGISEEDKGKINTPVSVFRLPSSDSDSNPQTPKPPEPKRRPDGLLESEMGLAMRLAGIFKRRESTPWKNSEVKAFRQFAVTAAPEDIDLVVWFYGTPVEFKRRDLGTLLNNFSSELDRARAQRNGQHSRQPTNSTERMAVNAGIKL